MDEKEMKAFLDKTGLSIAYSHFPDNQKPPFLCFLSNSSNIEVRKIITATASYCYNATSNNYSYVGGRTIDQNASYDASSVNSASYVSKTDSSSVSWGDYISDRGSTLFYLMPCIGTIQTSTSATVSKTFSMYCTAGEQVQLVEYYSGSKSYYIHSVNVTYQGR